MEPLYQRLLNLKDVFNPDSRALFLASTPPQTGISPRPTNLEPLTGQPFSVLSLPAPQSPLRKRSTLSSPAIPMGPRPGAAGLTSAVTQTGLHNFVRQNAALFEEPFGEEFKQLAPFTEGLFTTEDNRKELILSAIYFALRTPQTFIREAESERQKHFNGGRRGRTKTSYGTNDLANLIDALPKPEEIETSNQEYAQWIRNVKINFAAYRQKDYSPENITRGRQLGTVLQSVKTERVNQSALWKPWATAEIQPMLEGWTESLGGLLITTIPKFVKELNDAEQEIAELSTLQALLRDGTIKPSFFGKVSPEFMTIFQQAAAECGFGAAWLAAQFIATETTAESLNPWRSFFETIRSRDPVFTSDSRKMLSVPGLESFEGQVIDDNQVLDIVYSFANPAYTYSFGNKLTTLRGDETADGFKNDRFIERRVSSRLEGIYAPAETLSEESCGKRLFNNPFAKFAQIIICNEFERSQNPLADLVTHWVTLGVIQYSYGPNLQDRVRIYCALNSSNGNTPDNLNSSIARVELEILRKTYAQLIQRAIEEPRRSSAE